MASAMRVFRKFRSSDGRIKIATLSGVSALVAVIALLVGVLPVFASHSESEVKPVVVDLGGGSSHCSATTDDGRLPSAAGNAFHINNPTEGTHNLKDANGNEIKVIVEGPNDNRRFSFNVVAGNVVVYDVIVNGGPKSNHYDYDDNPGATGVAPPGPVQGDVELHAPRKGSKLHNLSHINICYDAPGKVIFACEEPLPLTEETGLFRVAEAEIFANSVIDACESKRASFSINNGDTPPSVTLAFEGDTGEKVAGRLDITKAFDSPADFANLQYDGPGKFVDLQWCEIRTPKATGDGDEFNDVLASNEYPSLAGVKDDIGTPNDPDLVDATACKVYEEENAAGVQHTVVYFEFVDPLFR